LIESDVLWSLVRMTVATFFAPTVTAPVNVHIERRNADRLCAVQHHGNEGGIEAAVVEERNVRHAVAIEIGDCGAEVAVPE